MKKAAVLIFALTVLSACSGFDNSPQKKFGADSNYFLALQAAEKGQEEESQRLFKISRKKGSSLVARKSAEALTLLGSVDEKIQACDYLANNYKDENSLSMACQQLFDCGEYAKVINLTEGLSLKDSKNELIKLRLLALAEKKDSRFDQECFNWYMARPLSSEHLETYSTYISRLQEKNKNIQDASESFQKNLNKRNLLESQLAPDYKEEEPLSIVPEGGFDPLYDALQEAENPEKTLMEYRIAVFHRLYKVTYPQVNKIFQIYKNRGEEIDCQLLSDVGKSTLYGTKDYFSSARTFDRLASNLSREKAYYAYFYAARLYDKAGRYPSQTISRFRSALKSTDDDLQFDNCLWYLLNVQLRTSTSDIISTLKEYGSRIHDAQYFDDFFESLSILLLSSHRWQDFYQVWKNTNSNFSDYTAGKYAYISGRLIEEGLAEGDKGLKTRQAVEAFTSVLNGASSLYYKICAMERLSVSDPALIESYLLKNNRENQKNNGDSDFSAGQLIKGYAAFGFPQRVYMEWLANRPQISLEDSMEISRFLKSCGENNSESFYNVQSLRIANRLFEGIDAHVPKELLKLNFPRFYKSAIENASKEFSLPEYLIYALVRSESFFDANATSKAGANGLTQLMEATADDEARKLKIEDNYDILDPETNIRMGCHYLSSLISRTDENNELLALYAYNAGLTNVRNWASRFRKDWAETGKPSRKPVGISMDLFLESLPFAETREYGRKVISAAAMYAYLYDGKMPSDVVREIMY
ncbi:MAG: lytic transglycosylase domain-containing protein [Treponema sp.]|nr:lytic transglycosylase domain-containing protein [Treponema sp.]